MLGWSRATNFTTHIYRRIGLRFHVLLRPDDNHLLTLGHLSLAA